MTQVSEAQGAGAPRTSRLQLIPLVAGLVVLALTIVDFRFVLLAPVTLVVALVFFFWAGRKGLALTAGLALNALLVVWIVAVVVNLFLNGR